METIGINGILLSFKVDSVIQGYWSLGKLGLRTWGLAVPGFPPGPKLHQDLPVGCGTKYQHPKP